MWRSVELCPWSSTHTPFNIGVNQTQCVSHLLLISFILSSLLFHFFFLLLVMMMALWCVSLAKLNHSSQNPFCCIFQRHRKDSWEIGRVEMKQCHFVIHIGYWWSAESPWWSSGWAQNWSTFFWFLLSQVCVLNSVTKGPYRIPLKPRSETRIPISDHCHGVLGHSCGHCPACDLPLLTACPEDFRCRDNSLNQPHNCISQVPVTSPLVLLLWLNLDWYRHYFDHDDTDKVTSSHLVVRSSTSMEKEQRAPKKP